MIASLLMLAGLAAGAAPVTSFSPADLAAAAAADSAPPVDARRTSTISDLTERLRLAIAYDPAGGVALRTPEEQDALIGALGLGEGSGDQLARWFMAGAIQQPVAGTRSRLYHPLSRGWLLLYWQRGNDGEWRISHAEMASAGLVPEPDPAQPWLTGLIADYAVTRSTEPYDPGLLVGIEAGRWITGLADFMHDGARRMAAEETALLIARGRTARLGGGAIDLMPERVRQSYAPIAGFERAEGGRSLIFGSPLYPHILIAADFDGTAELALSRITLVNLDNAGRGQ